jgi:hypothetical protein
VRKYLNAEEACARYAQCAGEIRRLTRLLRTTRCPEESGAERVLYGSFSPGAPAIGSCLDDFFAAPKGPDGEFPRYKEFYDQMCDICKAKLAAIDDRREWRKQLGAAKRVVENIGKRAKVSA